MAGQHVSNQKAGHQEQKSEKQHILLKTWSREGEFEVRQVYIFSNPAFSGMLPPVRQHLLNVPKQPCALGPSVKCLNTSHSNHHIGSWPCHDAKCI